MASFDDNDTPQYGERVEEPAKGKPKPVNDMTVGSWVAVVIFVALLVAFLGPIVINLWKDALGR